VSLNEKNETCDILVPNELKNAEHFNSTIRPTMKSSYRLTASCVQFQHFEQSLMFIAQTV